MKKLPGVALLIFLAATPADRRENLSDGTLFAGAAEAAIGSPREYRISDHYGDPSRFVKYIIRRPPVLA